MEASPGPWPTASLWSRYRVLLYLLVGLLGLDGLVRWQARLWDSYDPNDYAERLRHCQGRAWDLVVLGGSPVSEGIDSALLCPLVWRGREIRRVYNLGLPGGTTTDFWHALQHGVTAPPRLVVYGITASDLNDNRNSAAGPGQLMDLGDLAKWLAERPDSREWVLRQYAQSRLERCWGLYQYRNGIRLWAADQAERACPGLFPEAAAEVRKNRAFAADLRRGHGFAPQWAFQQMRYGVTKATGGAVAPFPFLDGFRLGQHLDCVHRIRAWAEARGADLVLVNMPVSADLEARHAGPFARYRAALRELETDYGFLVLRGDRATVGLDDDHFADLAHLNAWGVERFGHWLRAALARRGVTG